MKTVEEGAVQQILTIQKLVEKVIRTTIHICMNC